MFLKNNSKAMITVNTTPFISKQDALKKVKDGDTLEYSRINIPPTETREVPDEFCDCDFIKNLIDIGELVATSGISKTKKETKTIKKDTQSDLDAARDEAELNGVEWKKSWSVERINQEIEKSLG